MPTATFPTPLQIWLSGGMNRLSAWSSLRQSIHGKTQLLNPGSITQNFTKLRHQSSKVAEQSQTTTTVSRFDRLIARTPTKFLRSRLQVLKNAPLTHVSAFLLLHEITAIIPLFGLASAFHYYEWLPPFFAEGAWVLKGVNMFGNYFRRKGWIDAADADQARTLAEEGEAEKVEKNGGLLNVGKWWNRGEGGTRVVIEFATAYAIVKALMPIRIVISVWGAPWFARWTVIPIQRSFKKWWSSRKKG